MWPIKEKFLGWNIRKQLKKPAARKTVAFEHARRIGILFAFEGPVSAGRVRIFMQRLAEQHKQVQALAFSAKPLEEPLTDIDMYSRKDISLSGMVTSPEAQQFMHEPFDYLLYFGEVPPAELQTILAQSQARCRVGVYHPEAEACFELMIQGANPTQWDDLFQTFTSTIQKLRSAS